MQKRVIEELCEYLKMGTVEHLEGLPSLGSFFDLRYEQLREYKPSSKIINDISMRSFGQFDEPKMDLKEISPSLFDELVSHFSNQLQKLYEEFRNTLVDLENHS